MGIDLKAIDKAFKKIEKDNEGVIQDETTYQACKRIPCSSPEITKSLGGGLPVGRIIELFGEESSGKSLISYIIAKDFQSAGEFCCYFDFELTFSYEFARKMGLDTSSDKFKLIQPSTITEGFEYAEELANAGVGVFIFDSVSSMLTQAEIDGDYDKSHVGAQARSMSQGLKKLVPVLSENQTTAVFINQIREKIGCISPSTRISWS